MSDDIPTLTKAAKTAANLQVNFEPNDFQERVKARFWRRLSEQSHIYDAESAFSSKDAMVQLAGTERVLAWLEHPGFAAWFTDADLIVDLLDANKYKSVKTLVEIRDDADESAGDRIKAARTLLELADAFPGRKSEVRFLDDRLNDMPDDAVAAETRALQADLARLGDADGKTDED